MKVLRKIVLFLLCALLSVSLFACGKTGISGESGVLPKDDVDIGSPDYAHSVTGIGRDGYYISGKTAYDGLIDGIIRDGEIAERPNKEYSSGSITAMAWDDNVAYEDWKLLFFKGQGEEDSGKFQYYSDEKNDWGFKTLSRVKVTVKNSDGTLACGVKVFCEDENGEKQTVKTDNRGIAYLFPAENGTITVNGESNVFDKDNRDLSVEISENSVRSEKIRIMLVVDVTGSMGDELEYLKVELKDVINRTAALVEGAKIELALLFYRDHGDQEIFKYFDFSEVSDGQNSELNSNLETKIAELSSQRADGGGDYPEVVEEALLLAMEKDWGEDGSTNIIFHVLDAPPHSEKENRENYNAAIKTAAEKGIRMCPILCSGADSLTEYLTRQAAIYTGGTSIFVTDHSGIGNSHLDPEIPDAVVEKLNDLMIRLISGYYNGSFEAPVAYNTETQNVNDAN